MEGSSRFGNAQHLGPGWRWAAALGAAALVLLATASGHNARAQTPPAPIAVELNKLEPLPAPAAAPNATAAPAPGCRVYVVVANPDPEPITQLRLDLILFAPDGVIARRVALDLAPLAPHKTAVRLFDLPGQPCDGIGRMLVNDVLGCQFGKREDTPADEPRQACMDRLQLSSRAKAELTK